MHRKLYTFIYGRQNVGPNHKKRPNKVIVYVTRTWYLRKPRIN